ncbi:hypothetical protein DVK02_13755 [Halobellus sp. Atlit-31R]|nr:hypothetical protein DVK02_13755 [Halobellus sp. Atlit-31R]
MENPPTETNLDPALADSVVTTVRTGLGDTLRSVIAFSPSGFDVLYIRSDLYDSPEQVREAKGQLVEFERVGFAEAPIRTAIAETESRATIGPYAFTVRFHEEGFVVRQIVDDFGILFTTDSMDVRAFTETAVSIQSLLGDE